MGQTLKQEFGSAHSHGINMEVSQLLTSLPSVSASDFPFLGFRLLYGSVEGLDEAPCLKVTAFSSKAAFVSSRFPIPKSFFQSNES